MTVSIGSSHVAEPPRDKIQAMWRGFIGRCPNCGRGAMFRAYLKVNDSCSVCGEALHHQRADDAPPYVTMFVVGHIVVALLLAAEIMMQEVPFWLEAALWCAVTVGLSLLLLPRVKGAFVGLQWSLRMHGFGGGLEQANP